MDDSGEIEKRRSSLNRSLVAILCSLVLVIIVLIIIIVLVHVNNSDDIGSSEESNTGTLEQQIDAMIADDPSYQISLEISEVYWDKGDKEEAIRMYDEELENALVGEDYTLYKDLIVTRSSLLLMDDACDVLMAQYDKDSDKYYLVPEEYRYSIYATAINDSIECGDIERETYWRTIANE